MAFTCPVCKATSHHPRDEEEGYCGRCKAWTRPDALEQLERPTVTRRDENGP